MIETTTTPAAAQPQVLSRRRILGRAGVLAAAAAVTGTGLLGWRAVEQGVLAAGADRRMTRGGSSGTPAHSRSTWCARPCSRRAPTTRSRGGSGSQSLNAAIQRAELVESRADSHFIWLGPDWPTRAETIRAFLTTSAHPMSEGDR